MKDIKTLKYLVTGGAGFIGSHFIRRLFLKNKDMDVCVLDKLTYSGNRENLKEFENCPNFHFVKGDICDETLVGKLMPGVDVVVNFAAEAAVDRSIDDQQGFLKTDIFGVFVLLNAARHQKRLKKFLQISTDEVYGEIQEGSFTEESPLKPRNPYAASKLGGERLAYSYFATYRMPVIISRASNTYGPYAYPEKVIPLFITNLKDDLPVPVYGRGHQVRDWLYVDDHCRAVEFLIEGGEDGQVYNIGAQQECSNLELTHQILHHMKKDRSYVHFVNDRPGHDVRYSLDCSKIRRLGWRPKYSLADGLKKTVEWYLDNEAWWRPLKRNLDQKYIVGYWGAQK